MRADPEMKRGRHGFVCAVCGKPLNDAAVKYHDPFCATVCANSFHDFVPTSMMFTLGGRRANNGGGRPLKYDRKEQAA